MFLIVSSNQNVDKVIVQDEEPNSLSFESVSETETSQETEPEVETTTEKIVEEESQYPLFTYSKDWDYDDSYLLAKIAMAEAEGESIKGKTLVIMVVLNRVWSEKFPDTIKEVIFQYNKRTGVYQFSPIKPGGRWWTTEPNEECWEAVRIVQEAIYDYSEGALYFESCKNVDNWHSRNLNFLFQEGVHRFYK